MSAESSLALLADQLRDADDRTLTRIVGVIDRLGSRGVLDGVVDRHRDRLARLRPPRPITIARLLALPLETLLVDADAWQPTMLRIPRHRLGRLLSRITARLDPGLVDELQAEIEGGSMDDGKLVCAVGGRLWPAAAFALAEVVQLARQAQDEPTRELLAPLRVAERVLRVGEHVVRTVWALPVKPIASLDADATALMNGLLCAAAEQGRDCFLMAAELLVLRTELPLPVIDCIIAAPAALGERERMAAATTIAEACLAEMTRLLHGLDDSKAAIDLAAAMPALQSLVSNIESLQEAAASVKFDQRELRRLKAELFDRMEAFLAEALGGGVLEPFERLAEPDYRVDWEALERRAAAAAMLKSMARKVGLASRIDYLLQKALDRYRRILEGAAAPGPSSLGVDAIAMDRIRIMELLFGSGLAMQSLTRLRGGH